MVNLKKKGFTIIELVIVIAVIAVLAAVLIPTFSSLVKKANESVDIQLVRQLNTTLKADEIINGKPADINAVKTVLAKDGYENPVPVKSDGFFAWDPEENVVILINKESSLAVFPEKYKGESYTATWPILAGTVNKNMEDLGATLEEAINNAELGQTIVLSSDQTLNVTELPKNVSLNLGGHKLTLPNGIPVTQNSNVEISNGDVESSQISMKNGATLVLNDVNWQSTDAYAIYQGGHSSKLNINGGSIIADYGIGTSEWDGTNTGVIINLNGVTFGSEQDPCVVAIDMITSCDVEINNCIIYASRIGILNRCGNISIENTTVNYSRTEDYVSAYLTEGADKSYSYLSPNSTAFASWSGNTAVNPAPIVIGDFHAKNFNLDANCIIKNVTVNCENDTYPDVYLSQANYVVSVRDASTGVYSSEVVPGTKNIFKTTLTCDDSVKWEVNSGDNSAYKDKFVDNFKVFENYAGFYLATNFIDNSNWQAALMYVDNVFVNGVEQAAGSTSTNPVPAN